LNLLALFSQNGDLKSAASSQKDKLASKRLFKLTIPLPPQRMYLPHECVDQPNGLPFSGNLMLFAVIGARNVVTNGMMEGAGIPEQPDEIHLRRRTNLCHNGGIKH
jgi:hypothetical protein